MNKSATSINYEIRPCKFVERRMFLASISRILGAVRQGKNYQYIGFGGCSFTDFKLFHRELQIDKMISIEGDTYSDSKLDYNKPFNCIDIRRGQSDEVLPQIDLSIPSIIWLDYDGVLKNYMFTDVETIFHTVPAGSFFIFSCNRELKRGNYEELDDIYDSKNNIERNQALSPKELKEVFNDLVPFEIDKDACASDKSFDTIKKMLDKKINSVLQDRFESKNEKLYFELLYNIKYQEKGGAKMYTYGGFIFNDTTNLESVYINDFDFISKNNNDSVYTIDVPVLTHKEALLLNQYMFDEEREKKIIEEEIVSEKDLKNYKKIYKYCPSFHDVRF